MEESYKVWKESASLLLTIVLAFVIVIGFFVFIFTAFPTREEVEEYKYELITTKDNYQTEGYISGNRWHISGRIGTEEVYRLYYWIDKSAKEADYQTLYVDQTELFFDIKEDEMPYIVITQTVRYRLDNIRGSKTKCEVISEVYELHLPENAIIQDFEIDLE